MTDRGLDSAFGAPIRSDQQNAQQHFFHAPLSLHRMNGRGPVSSSSTCRMVQLETRTCPCDLLLLLRQRTAPYWPPRAPLLPVRLTTFLLPDTACLAQYATRWVGFKGNSLLPSTRKPVSPSTPRSTADPDPDLFHADRGRIKLLPPKFLEPTRDGLVAAWATEPG